MVVGCASVKVCNGGVKILIRQMIVRDAKGRESQVTMLPSSAIEPLTQPLQLVKQIHQQDLEQGCGSVYLPCIATPST